MEKIKVALIGCGRISYKHFQALFDNQTEFKLAAVCDINFSDARQAGEKHRTPFFTCMKKMLETVEIDLVSICTPSGLHPQHSLLAFKYGKHVVTEKPMACRVSDAQKMIEAAHQAQRKLFVVKQNRLNPTVLALKKAIDYRDFGKIYLVHSNVFWSRPQEYYDQAKWRGTWAYDGGALMNQASHYIDLLEYLLGPIDTVQAMTKTLGRNIEVEDTGVVNFEWKSGVLGSMAVTMLTYPKNMEGSITIIGEKGTARLDGVALNEIKHWYFENSRIDTRHLGYEPENIYGNGHGPYYKNIADVLLRQAKPVSDGHSGIKSVELLCTIYESAKTGNKVSVEDFVQQLQSNQSVLVN